jgi:hypothetical protein
MSFHRSLGTHRILTWFLANAVLSGFASLIWLALRSAAKPSRLTYPCQQAALTTAWLAFGSSVVTAAVTARRMAGRIVKNRRFLAAAGVGLLATAGLYGFLSSSTAANLPKIDPPPDYRARVFHVTNCPESSDDGRFAGLDNLVELMGRTGLKFYRSPTRGLLSAPEGIFGADDVIVVKINYQWSGCGGTNTDLLRGLIQILVEHPDGFTGEVVVAENAQFASVQNFDRQNNNASDSSLSPHDVVVGFQNQGLLVSHTDWTQIRSNQVDEFSSCDHGAGYVVLPAPTAGRISFPKFRTDYGTCVSLGKGVWDPAFSTFDRSRLRVINLPVLKPHGYEYAVTACVKNYMGLVTNSLGTDSHAAVRYGLMGAVMAEIGLPDLNILDAINVVGDPHAGPGVSCQSATRLNQLVASTDPIAADMWATTNILIPAFMANGHTPPWPDPDATPDDPNSVFRTYLDNSMTQLLAGGYRVTNDLDNMDVSSWNGFRTPRRPSGRVGG